MGKHTFLSSSTTGDIIELFLRDSTGRKIMTYKFNYNDDHAWEIALTGIWSKTGYKPSVKFESINTRDEWLDKSVFEI